MLTKVLSASHFGLKTIPIDVEVNVSKRGFPSFNIIGLPDKSVEEAKERVKTAIVNSGIDFPEAKIIVNLAPADIPKEGSCFDLPIAIGILASLEIVNLPSEKSFFYGELSLDGEVRHTKGVFILALAAKELSIKNVFIPSVSANEAACVKGLKVFPVNSLKSLISHLNKEHIIKPLLKSDFGKDFDFDLPEFDFSEILGQEQAKRALTIAASGGHNIFMQGPPGAGKTMLARALPGILPPLTQEESLEVSRIYSITGNIPPGGSLIRVRPFRSSHHTISRVGLIGGGSNPHPGEISLAHRGVLFLDEFPEFPRGVLEALRQPLEDGEVSIARAAGSVKYPCDFMLVASANPCPCGYLGDTKKVCKCSPRQIMKYTGKLSGPLMDRIDIHINVPAVDVEKLIWGKLELKKESSRSLMTRVKLARGLQGRRFTGTRIYTNASMRNRDIQRFCKIEPKALSLLKQAVNNFGLSARTYFRLIKVSQTISDLASDSSIKEEHVAESLQYRIRIQETN